MTMPRNKQSQPNTCSDRDISSAGVSVACARRKKGVRIVGIRLTTAGMQLRSTAGEQQRENRVPFCRQFLRPFFHIPSPSSLIPTSPPSHLPSSFFHALWPLSSVEPNNTRVWLLSGIQSMCDVLPQCILLNHAMQSLRYDGTSVRLRE